MSKQIVTFGLIQDEGSGRLPTVKSKYGKAGDGFGRGVITKIIKPLIEARVTNFSSYKYICTLGQYQLLQNTEDNLYTLVWEEEIDIEVQTTYMK